MAGSASTDSVNFDKLRKVQSLLFGAQIALKKKDFETALGLALRLVTFLESESGTAEDRIYINPILKKAYSLVDSAKQALPDRCAVEQAACSENFPYTHTDQTDVDKNKKAKLFQPLISRNGMAQEKSVPQRGTLAPNDCIELRQSPALDNGTQQCIGDPLVRGTPLNQDRHLFQSKITTIYGAGANLPPENSRPHPTHYRDAVKACQQELSDKRTTQLPAQESTDLSEADFFPPSDGDDEKTNINTYGFSRNRVRNFYGNKRSYEKSRSHATDEDNEEDDVSEEVPDFVTAKQKMAMDASTNRAPTTQQGNRSTASSVRNAGLKTLGVSRRGVRSSFIPPQKPGPGSGYCSGIGGAAAITRTPKSTENGPDDSTRRCMELLAGPDGELPERLRNLEPKLLEHVSNEIMDQDPNVRWDDIAGLEHAKKCVTEMVIWPLLRPDIFQGCRAPGKGLLLFGPPGTGKTMIGKAIAGEAKATFFSISASSLTSKWIGEGEKLVRALFGVASCRQPAVIFIDEVDSLLSQRKADGEHESSRRLKTQFLIEMEGCGSGSEQILLIGATNRPQELDEAARRRLSKRLYIPMPSAAARAWIIRNLLKKDELLSLSDDEVDVVCTNTEGYSGSDMKNLVKEASMGPLREAIMQGKDISKITKDEMRPITLQDFLNALQQIRPSVSQSELGLYEDWNRQFGSLTF